VSYKSTAYVNRFDKYFSINCPYHKEFNELLIEQCPSARFFKLSKEWVLPMEEWDIALDILDKYFVVKEFDPSLAKEVHPPVKEEKTPPAG
jgi:hypothetical protein